VTGELHGLLGLPVRHRGITLGHVSDVLVGETSSQPVGVEVVTVAAERAFLPWPSLELRGDEVVAPYPLALLAEAELDYYRRRGRSVAGTVDPDAVARR
jgi:hypothetical protein